MLVAICVHYLILSGPRGINSLIICNEYNIYSLLLSYSFVPLSQQALTYCHRRNILLSQQYIEYVSSANIFRPIIHKTQINENAVVMLPGVISYCNQAIIQKENGLAVYTKYILPRQQRHTLHRIHHVFLERYNLLSQVVFRLHRFCCLLLTSSGRTITHSSYF